MEKLFDLLIWTVIFCAGYFVGSREVKKDFKEKIEELSAPKIEPGVVRHLTDEEVKEKHNTLAQGNLEAFNEFFKKFPVIGKLKK